MKRRRPVGMVYLVGAGPGDPGLVTVRGQEILRGAEVVISDALAPDRLLRLAPRGAEVVRLRGVEGRGRIDQAAINRLMIARARRGRVVVRLKGGDPYVFGRGDEEAEALWRAGVPFEVVPGVPAAIGAAAYAGIPLTDRRSASCLALATARVGRGGRAKSLDWRALSSADTVIIYMGARRLASVANGLIAAGRDPDTPAAVVRWATRPEQAVLRGTLSDIEDRARRARIDPPALLFVGEAVSSRPHLDWHSRRPLVGRTIVVTRAREQAGSLAESLGERGARVIEAPAISFAPPASWEPVDRALRRIDRYRYLIFTSVNGVESFFERLRRRRVDVRSLGKSEVLAIGPATAAALERHGIQVAAVPEEFRAEGIVRILGRRSLLHAGVLIPRAAVARDLLVRELRVRGAQVDVVPVYRTVASREGSREVIAALRSGAVDLITFTASSTVEFFARKFRSPADRRLLRAVPAAVIGPITAATARRHGFRIAVCPAEYTVPALSEAIVRRLGRKPARIRP